MIAESVASPFSLASAEAASRDRRRLLKIVTFTVPDKFPFKIPKRDNKIVFIQKTKAVLVKRSTDGGS